MCSESKSKEFWAEYIFLCNYFNFDHEFLFDTFVYASSMILRNIQLIITQLRQFKAHFLRLCLQAILICLCNFHRILFISIVIKGSLSGGYENIRIWGEH